jgi:predicted MFS family arabinose efflux permease
LGNWNGSAGFLPQGGAVRRSASEKRSTAFGIFDTGFGVAWFAGSAAMGVLYDKSIPALVLFSVLLQILALPVLAFGKKAEAFK